MGHLVLGLLLVGSLVQAGWISVQPAGYSRAIACLHPTSKQQQPNNGQPMW